MALTIKAPDVDVPNAEGDLYAAPAATTAVVRGRFVNVSGSATTLTIYRRANAGSSFQLHETLTIEPGKEWIMPIALFLAAQGALRGVAGAASAIKATLNVLERT